MADKPDKPAKGAENIGGKTVALPTRKLLDSLAAPQAAGDDLGRIPLPAGWEISLDVLEGPQKGMSFPVTRSRVLIGRAADITLDDPRVSRRHASLEVYGSACVLLKDLDSTNGTFVNGRRVQSVELQDGDEIRVGGSLLSVTIGAPP
ncbi:MAG: FHA domain-containing protein [Acidobacteriota bacterium]|nr:FHA domain-containing protein [Acidobacteriota bacterium]